MSPSHQERRSATIAWDAPARGEEGVVDPDQVFFARDR